MEKEEKFTKLESLGTAVMVGAYTLKQLNSDRDAYIEAFAKQQEEVIDPRVASFHKAVYNTNVNAYATSLKAVEELLETYKEELENETKNSQAGTDSEAQ